MKKTNNKGFMLVETLIVTTFVAGVLIFLYIQFSTLNNSYNNYFDYNSTEKLYALEDIKNYIQNDSNISNIPNLIKDSGYIEITDCEIFIDKNFCLKLLELEDINKLYLIHNNILSTTLSMEDIDALNFFKATKSTNNSIYILIGKFNDGSYSLLNIDGIPNISN